MRVCYLKEHVQCDPLANIRVLDIRLFAGWHFKMTHETTCSVPCEPCDATTVWRGTYWRQAPPRFSVRLLRR